MADYIERVVAFNAILKLVPKVDGDGYCWVIRGDAAQAIDSIPPADVAEVRNGKWENQSPVFCWNKYGVYQTAYKCSVCGELTPIDYNICPWCGARMDGE